MSRSIAIIVAIILIGLLLVAAFSKREVQQIFLPSPTPTPAVVIAPTSTTTPTQTSPTPTISPLITTTFTLTPTPRPGIDIRVSSPQPNQIITSPLRITGQARGSWFFEATAPIRLVDGNGRNLATSFITAQGDWMTSNF